MGSKLFVVFIPGKKGNYKDKRQKNYFGTNVGIKA